jgi:phosphoglycolate phosphatase-like HAD superfamily hydrolase
MDTRRTVVLFDIDGTLITCGGAGRQAVKAAFLEIAGRDDVCDFPFDGGTDRGIARRGLMSAGLEPTEEAIDALLACYLRHLPGAIERSVRYAVMPGVHALLDALRDHEGLAIGLGTGNVEEGAFAKLRRGQLDAHFAFGGFGCDHEERPRLLDAGASRGAARLEVAREACRVVIVGDTPKDVAAAHAIGAECVAVATGSHGRRELEQAGARIVLEDLRAPEALAVLLS